MNLDEFAARRHLRVKRHEDGGLIIAGRLGHIYEHGHGRFGLLFMPGKPRLWAIAKRKLEAAGFLIWQDGDEEGSALFDPNNPDQVWLASKVARVRRKRRATPAQLANLRKGPGREPCSEPESEIVAGVAT